MVSVRDCLAINNPDRSHFLTIWSCAKQVFLAQFCICVKILIVYLGFGLTTVTLVRNLHLWCMKWVDIWFLL